MNRQALLRRVSEQSGVNAKRQHLAHAIATGRVPPAKRADNGWCIYTDEHLRGLIQYMQCHSRTRLMAEAAQ